MAACSTGPAVPLNRQAAPSVRPSQGPATRPMCRPGSPDEGPSPGVWQAAAWAADAQLPQSCSVTLGLGLGRVTHEYHTSEAALRTQGHAHHPPPHTRSEHRASKCWRTAAVGPPLHHQPSCEHTHTRAFTHTPTRRVSPDTPDMHTTTALRMKVTQVQRGRWRPGVTRLAPVPHTGDTQSRAQRLLGTSRAARSACSCCHAPQEGVLQPTSCL
jgi:hypothetical protein